MAPGQRAIMGYNSSGQTDLEPIPVGLDVAELLDSLGVLEYDEQELEDGEVVHEALASAELRNLVLGRALLVHLALEVLFGSVEGLEW